MFLIGLWQILDELWMGNGRRSWAPLREYLDRDHLVTLLGEFADGVFTSLLERHRQPRIVDHTPWYARLIPFINVLYPDSVFVHVVRDGRVVVESLSVAHTRGFPWAGADIEQRTRLWTDLVESGAAGLERLPDERSTTVRYERLCAEPEETLRQLSHHLGLPWYPGVLGPLAVEHATPSRAGTSLATHDSRGRLVLKPRTGRTAWPVSWSSEERDRLRAVGGPLLQNLGYAVLA